MFGSTEEQAAGEFPDLKYLGENNTVVVVTSSHGEEPTRSRNLWCFC